MTRRARRLASLAALALEDLSRLAVSGRLRGETLGLVLEGGSRYAAAIVSGDVVGRGDGATRARTCLSCHLSRRRALPLRRSWAVYCGEPLDPAVVPGTCGCPVALTVYGRDPAAEARVLPAGRALVASASCPLAAPRWGPAPAEGRRA